MRPTLVRVPEPTAQPLAPETVLPRLRGSFGRAYHYAVETPSTQSSLPDDAPHGAVALAEHQTEGRGRLGRVWVDEPGAGLAFSIVLRPPPPVARWPELTLVAARGGRRRDRRRRDDQGSERRPPRRPQGRRDPRRGEASHVVLGIGVNVGSAPWPGAAAVERDRLELLVEILDRLERGYDAWAARLTAS